jgi:hypothetical protein
MNKHNIGLPARYIAIRDSIKDLYRELNTGEYDRAEKTIAGIQIRCWRTRINCRTETHLGWKSPWEKDYHETTVKQLTELLERTQERTLFDYLRPVTIHRSRHSL